MSETPLEITDRNRPNAPETRRPNPKLSGRGFRKMDEMKNKAKKANDLNGAVISGRH